MLSLWRGDNIRVPLRFRDIGWNVSRGTDPAQDVEPFVTSPAVKGVLSFLKDIAVIIGTALVVSFLVKTFLLRSFYIPSESMQSTLLVNDRIIVNELTPDLMPLNRGDVIVFSDPGGWLGHTVQGEQDWFQSGIDAVLTVVGLGAGDSDEHLVKRLIGLPGDVVSCCDAQGRLMVNGVAIDEPYIQLPAGETSASEMDFEVTVPEGGLWVMGDNRYDSADSRYNQGKPGNGFVPIDNVVGRAFVVSWPLERWSWLDNYPEVFANVD
ncbi:MAG: signal peptidase [Actinomycetota bacterium]|jgi:signal peptidase I